MSAFLRMAFFLALIGVAILSMVPMPKTDAPEFSDKIAHTLCFLILAALYCRAYSVRNLPWRVLLALLCYGLLIELIQFFLPWRSFSLFDLAADFGGLLLFVGGASVRRRVRVGA